MSESQEASSHGNEAYSGTQPSQEGGATESQMTQEKPQSQPETAGRQGYSSLPFQLAGEGIMSFAPLSNVRQHLSGLHCYATDPKRQVRAHHFCSHRSSSPSFHQCIIYDSDKPDARLIGIEYVVAEELFDSLPQDEKKVRVTCIQLAPIGFDFVDAVGQVRETTPTGQRSRRKWKGEEKKLWRESRLDEQEEANTESRNLDELRFIQYWHSHKYEVESGMLYLGTKSLVPNTINDSAEGPAMIELSRTYGKTIHTWQFDLHPDVPLGPPHLMMSFTKDEQVDASLLQQRDDDMGISSAHKRELRTSYLPKSSMEHVPSQEADRNWNAGKGISFEAVERDVA